MASVRPGSTALVLRLENVVESTTGLTGEEKQEVDEKRQSHEKVAGGIQCRALECQTFSRLL